MSLTTPGWFLRPEMLLILVPVTASLGQAPDYHSELAAARREVVKTPTLTIHTLNLGEPRIGKNRFTALVTNKVDKPMTLGLDLRTEAGVWPSGRQVQLAFFVWPGQERQIEGEYEFTHMSPEATLRVRFFFPRVAADGVTQMGEFFFQKKFYVGKGNKAVDYDIAQRFRERDTEHFHIYFLASSFRGSGVRTKFFHSSLDMSRQLHTLAAELWHASLECSTQGRSIMR